MPWYGVQSGRVVGVFTDWKDVQRSIMGFPGAKFKKFEDEASARAFCLGDTHFGDDVEITNNETKTKTKTKSLETWFNIYTDGSCIGNGTSRAIAGYGVCFGKNHPKNLSARVPDEYPQTNNTGELMGIIKALEIVKDELDMDNLEETHETAASSTTSTSSRQKVYNVRIYSDSEYAIRCATTYGRRCEAQGWKKEIPNQTLIQNLLSLIDELMGLGIKIDFQHVLAHTGKQDEHSQGNEMADTLANLAVGITSSISDSSSHLEDRLDLEEDDLRSFGKQRLQDIPGDRKEYIDVKFEKKEGAKILGARWDAKERSWYIPKDCDPDFAKALRKLFK
jgi:ribonuclease HI